MTLVACDFMSPGDCFEAWLSFSCYGKTKVWNGQFLYLSYEKEKPLTTKQWKAMKTEFKHLNAVEAV